MTTPDLKAFDVILVNSSGGKDSQAMLDYVVELAIAADVKDRIVVVHADLGRVEWAGTRDLAAEQAAHYGLRFEVVRREKGDLLDQVALRGKWPDSQNRYCTSDQKRDQVSKLMTALANERASNGAVTILNCMGLRAEESPVRAKKVALQQDGRNTNSRRNVTTWLPILDWTVDQVWARIRKSGVRHHRAYDLGMGRLSCVFCVFAPKAALMIAGQHNPELLDAYVAVEQQIGHTFRKGFTIESVRTALRTGTPVIEAAEAASQCWGM
jgi:3'-phosphoadenosine 5'-phosphosulfate sulfotransferase (PAPS reductase)/FAD synthetase